MVAQVETVGIGWAFVPDAIKGIETDSRQQLLFHVCLSSAALNASLKPRSADMAIHRTETKVLCPCLPCQWRNASGPLYGHACPVRGYERSVSITISN